MPSPVAPTGNRSRSTLGRKTTTNLLTPPLPHLPLPRSPIPPLPLSPTRPRAASSTPTSTTSKDLPLRRPRTKLKTTSTSLHKQVLSDLTKDYLADQTYHDEFRHPKLLEKKDGLLVDKQGRLCVPDGSTRLVLIHDSHDAIVSGHLGVAKTLDRLTKNFTCPSMFSQVTAYISTSDRCQRDKSSNQRPAGLLQSLEVPNEPWAHFSMGFFMALPPSGDFDVILVVVDKLSKSIVLIPTHIVVTAKDIARLYFNQVYCRHGLARKFTSDRDARFTGAFCQELHRLLHVKLAMSPSFHPETGGQTERANRTMEEMVQRYLSHRQNDWQQLLPALEFMNNYKHRATGTSHSSPAPAAIPSSLMKCCLDLPPKVVLRGA
jgi:Integrase zinc binding domain